MGISVIHEDITDEELSKYILMSCKVIGQSKNLKIFFVNEIKGLDILKKDRSKNKIIITKNISPEFITEAVNITENIVYRGSDFEVITDRVKNILEKSKECQINI